MKEILIVEDNEDNSLLLLKMMTHYGYRTATAPHGHAALEYCETHQPDLILMDLSLPDMDGMEVTRLLRQKKQFEHIPIIAITAHAMHGIRETAEEAGLNDFIAKPFMPQELIDLVRKYLQEKP